MISTCDLVHNFRASSKKQIYFSHYSFSETFGTIFIYPPLSLISLEYPFKDQSCLAPEKYINWKPPRKETKCRTDPACLLMQCWKLFPEVSLWLESWLAFWLPSWKKDKAIFHFGIELSNVPVWQNIFQMFPNWTFNFFDWIWICNQGLFNLVLNHSTCRGVLVQHDCRWDILGRCCLGMAPDKVQMLCNDCKGWEESCERNGTKSREKTSHHSQSEYFGFEQQRTRSAL